ncbi:MAG: thioredoxin 2 [Paraglaciecola sp.]|jgi:thioredoxin 2
MSDFSQIVCPQCWTINRIAKPRLADSPNCGKCKESIFYGRPVTLSIANFTRFTQRNDIPIMIAFWAPWSPDCEMMMVAFNATANTLEPFMRLAMVNIDTEESIASRLGVKQLPCLVIIHYGQELGRKNGVMDSTNITKWANHISAGP